ncbi:unnamed protein product [Didymodactylos carnosus]|uniref:Uncharacterized protein n=1 Tax=Didymodactylos carnosus TaxID=1234261 RepID=A0A816AHN2_9BILA|nr:unnamed protein product [Didymodactylos carnosus]CAF1597628.1 unnamed protein product [Didymodactylos carnosus]CAF3841276.1 unnamed protein product [Didymodactylos carnosus]CAF4473081.1 unnamed protein product [Didymodactylos carnosus]
MSRSNDFLSYDRAGPYQFLCTGFNAVYQFLFLICFQSSRIESKIDRYAWMYYEPYGSTVSLVPLKNVGLCDDPKNCYWETPSKQQLNVANSIHNDKYELKTNGTLIIKNINSNDNGIYHFHKQNKSQHLVSKALLNLHGAPFRTLWLEYWPNVLGGILAMASIFALYGVGILIDKYRYRAPDEIYLNEQRGTIPPLVIQQDHDYSNTHTNQGII